jgi:succinoglycan biosynthesis transport protein ExoP
MLQSIKPQTVPQSSDRASEYLSPAELFKIFTGFVLRQYPVVVFTFLVMMALAFIYLFTTPRSFTAEAKLMIDTRKVQLFQQQSVLGDIPPDPWSVDTQVEILQSENVALAVIKDLHLTEDPEFMSPREGLIPTMKGWL